MAQQWAIFFYSQFELSYNYKIIIKALILNGTMIIPTTNVASFS